MVNYVEYFANFSGKSTTCFGTSETLVSSGDRETDGDNNTELTADQRNAIQQASAAGLGALIGASLGGDSNTVNQSAQMALRTERFNRQLHPTEEQRIKELANGDKEKELRLTAAACALVHCSAHIPSDDPDYAEAYAKAKALEDLGNQAEFASERALLRKQEADIGQDAFSAGAKKTLFNYNGVDKVKDYDDSGPRVIVRAGGLAQATGGVAAVALGTGMCETGLGCIAGVPVAAYGADNAVSGARTVYSGKYHSTIGAKALADLTGINPETAELIYSSPSMAFGVKPIAMGATKVTGTVANEVARIGEDVKYVAGGLGKDLKAGYHSIPNSYKVVFGIEASINATAESISYFTGKKESSLDNLGGSASKVLVDSTYATMFSKANSTVGFIADTAKNLSDGKNLENSLTNAATSLGVSKVSGVLIKDDNIKRIINSGSTKLIESVTEEGEGK